LLLACIPGRWQSEFETQIGKPPSLLFDTFAAAMWRLRYFGGIEYLTPIYVRKAASSLATECNVSSCKMATN